MVHLVGALLLKVAIKRHLEVVLLGHLDVLVVYDAVRKPNPHFLIPFLSSAIAELPFVLHGVLSGGALPHNCVIWAVLTTLVVDNLGLSAPLDLILALDCCVVTRLAILNLLRVGDQIL